MYRQGAIPKEQLDEIKFNSRALSERLANARSNLEELQNGTRSEQLKAQQAAVNQLAAEIKDLDITIAKSVLKSPFDGVVSVRNLDEGTVIEAGRPVMRLLEVTRPEVKIGVPISVANKMQLGSMQQVTIGGEQYSATVSSILPEVDRATRTRSVVLKLSPTTLMQISPGQIARLAVDTRVPTDGYWLPVTALVKSDRGLWSCYEGNKTEVDRRYVEILETQGDRVLVRGTLQPGDEIVTNGTHRLVPGQLVAIDKE